MIEFKCVCDAITSKLLITHYFVVEFSSIVMLWLQNWWLPTILWIMIKHICIAIRSLQRWWLTTILLTDFFVLPLFRGSNSTNAVWRASRNARIFRRTFSWALLILFCDRIHMHCDAVTSKMMIDHYFVDRFSCFTLFRGPNSTNAMRRAHEIVWLHENTIQHICMGNLIKVKYHKFIRFLVQSALYKKVKKQQEEGISSRYTWFPPPTKE